MNKIFFGGLIVSLLMMSLVGCPTDGGGGDSNDWITKEHTVTLTYPHPSWPNATKAEAMEDIDLWSQLSQGVEIEIPDENVKEVDYESFRVYWTDDTEQ